MIPNYFLPFCKLVVFFFYFLDNIHRSTRVFKFDGVHITYFSFVALTLMSRFFFKISRTLIKILSPLYSPF